MAWAATIRCSQVMLDKRSPGGGAASPHYPKTRIPDSQSLSKPFS